MRSSKIEIQIEITEVQTPGRRRDKEFKEYKNDPLSNALSPTDWDKVEEAKLKWVDWTAAAIKKKLKYSKDIKFDIVVYNNINNLFEISVPDLARLSKIVGELLAEVDYRHHWVWQCRSTRIDLLWPRLMHLQTPNWKDRF